MSGSVGRGVVLGLVLTCLVGLCVLATDAELYFATDKAGLHRVTNIQEGKEVWVVVFDPDENVDCDVRDKIWTDVKIFDPKTGALSSWVSYLNQAGDANGFRYDNDDYIPYKGHWPGTPGWLQSDYLEETGADTGLFVSKRPFRIGTRENYDVPRMNTHVVCASPSPLDPGEPWLEDFSFGNLVYEDGRVLFADYEALVIHLRDWIERSNVDEYRLPEEAIGDPGGGRWLAGRFENMDTLVGLYQDQNDESDVAVAMMKIIDVEAVIEWERDVYLDCNDAATLTIHDADENLDCGQAEYVPVFILVNPGSWNPVQTDSPTTFCALKRTGGVSGTTGELRELGPLRWFNMYHSLTNAFEYDGAMDGLYYIEYPTVGDDNVVFFDTTDPNGYTAVSFYAQETGVDTGVFQLNFNSLCEDLGFESLAVRDVIAAYYLDPNDEDDFKVATTYIEARQHSTVNFTDAERVGQNEYWIGRDPIYVQVVDANANVDSCCPENVLVHICDPHDSDDVEWLILDETASNSPIFFSQAGMSLRAIWDGQGLGTDPGTEGGFQLMLDNWRFEAFNEDDVLVRYNDVYYRAADPELGLVGLGDNDHETSFPPWIERVRVANDVSFDMMSIADTQVFDGQSTQMWFLDRAGSRIDGLANSDCLFIQVFDPDQNEDVYRRERIAGFWQGGHGNPTAPLSMNDFGCDYERRYFNDWNRLFGDTNILNNGPETSGFGFAYNVVHQDTDMEHDAGLGAIYLLNPRNGRWAAVDLVETGVSSGEFVSVACIDLSHVYDCVPTLGALPGDTILAVYQDPSNHSDSAWISIKVGVGGASASPGQQSETAFVDAAGGDVIHYTDTDPVYVRVVDPSHAGETTLSGLLVNGEVADLFAVQGADSGVFMTLGLDLDLSAGEQLAATYTDPRDLTDTSSDTIGIVSGVLDVKRFYAAPNPFDTEVIFGFEGNGVASSFHIAVYDLAGKKLWETTAVEVAEVAWDGGDLANGAYIYTATVTDGSETFTDSGKLFVKR